MGSQSGGQDTKGGCEIISGGLMIWLWRIKFNNIHRMQLSVLSAMLTGPVAAFIVLLDLKPTDADFNQSKNTIKATFNLTLTVNCL